MFSLHSSHKKQEHTLFSLYYTFFKHSLGQSVQIMLQSGRYAGTTVLPLNANRPFAWGTETW